MGVPRAQRPRGEGRGAGPPDRRRLRGKPRDIRVAQGAPGAAQAGREDVAKARGAHNVGVRLVRHHQGKRPQAEGHGQASRPCAEGTGPGRQGLQRQGAQRGVVRRHHVRPNQAGMALHGGSDGHLVAQGRGLVDGAEDDGRAGGRRAADGDIDQEARPGLHPPQRPRLPVRVAAHGEDHARRGHQAVDGRDIVAVGQRGHRVADGVHKVRVRARPHLRQPRAGRAGDIRLHRGILQPREDPLGARLAESRRVRESQLEGPHAGGIGPVNENGADSDSDSRQGAASPRC